MRRAVFNQKGGVGKTSITCNLAAISAAFGQKTLVVDLDAQGDTTNYLVDGIDEDAYPDEAHGVAALFKQTLAPPSKARNPDSFVWETPYDDLYLMPSSRRLSGMEKELESRSKIYKLRNALDKLDGEYDLIYIDTPPNFGFYTKAALIAAHSLLVPFDCDSFARHSLDKLKENVEELREDHNPSLKLEGVVINQYSTHANLPAELVAELKKDKDFKDFQVLGTYLHTSVKMRESHRERRPLIDLAPGHKLTAQYLALYRELEARAAG